MSQSVADLYLLAAIAPSDIRRKVCASVEKKKQEANEAHSLFRQKSAEKRLHSRNCLLSSVHPAEFPAKVVGCSEWQNRLKDQQQYKPVLIDENFATGHKSNWTTWRCLNRIRTEKHAARNNECSFT